MCHELLFLMWSRVYKKCHKKKHRRTVRTQVCTLLTHNAQKKNSVSTHTTYTKYCVFACVCTCVLCGRKLYVRMPKCAYVSACSLAYARACVHFAHSAYAKIRMRTYSVRTHNTHVPRHAYAQCACYTRYAYANYAHYAQCAYAQYIQCADAYVRT